MNPFSKFFKPRNQQTKTQPEEPKEKDITHRGFTEEELMELVQEIDEAVNRSKVVKADEAVTEITGIVTAFIRSHPTADKGWLFEQVFSEFVELYPNSHVISDVIATAFMRNLSQNDPESTWIKVLSRLYVDANVDVSSES